MSKIKDKKKKFGKSIKIIFGYILKKKWAIFILTVFGLLSAVGNGVIPYIMGKFFDSILSDELVFVGTDFVIPMFFFLLIIWVIIQFINALLDWAISIRGDKLGVKVRVEYQTENFKKILAMPMSFHKRYKLGDVTHKLNMSANRMEDIIAKVITRLGPKFLSIFIAFIIAFKMRPSLAVVLILGVSMYIVILINKIGPLAEMQRKLHKIWGRLFGSMYDTISNVKAVKQSNSESYEVRSMRNKHSKKAVSSWIEIFSVWQDLSFHQRVSIMVTQIIIFILSVIYIRDGIMTIGELIAFNAYAAMVFGPFVTLGTMWQTVQNGLVDIEEADKLFSEPKENYHPKNAVILDELKGAISFENVSYGYEKKRPILKNISFDILPGEIVALVGESGVGKSTLIDLISGFHFPQKGKIYLDGHNILSLDLKFLRSQISVVPQEVVLFNDTIKKNIKYGNFGVSDKQLEEAAKKSHALEFIKKFPKKWKQIVGERGIKLSVGQKQRVAIARAILRNPKILILDEPTSALDAEAEKIITESLEKLMKGKTTFIIAHRLSTVRKADKIIVLKNGRVVEVGNHKKLVNMKDGVYRHLYELQVGLHK